MKIWEIPVDMTSVTRSGGDVVPEASRLFPLQIPGRSGLGASPYYSGLSSPLICPDIKGYNDSMVIKSDFLSVSVNKADGTFTDVSEAAGVAYDASGLEQGSMGVDRVEVRWLRGCVDVVEKAHANQVLAVTETSPRAQP